MKSVSRRARLVIAAGVALLILFFVPVLALSASPVNGLSGIASSIGNLIVFSESAGPAVYDPLPTATANQYAPISVSYSDPDGIELVNTSMKPKLWFDGYDATKCAAGTSRPGITATETGISWDHTVVTEWGGPTGCKVITAGKEPMSEGLHTAKIQVWDKLGNSSTFEWTVSFDQTPPVIAIGELCGTYSDDNTPHIRFGYSDDSGVDTSTVLLKIDNAIAPATAGATEVVYDSGMLAEGRHDLSLSLSDTLGNPAASFCSFTVDTLAPEITSVTPAEGGHGSVNQHLRATWADQGAGIDQYSASLELDSIDVTATATFDQDGASYQAYGLATGAHTAHIHVSDYSGKVTDRTWSFTVEVDDTPPVITVPAPLTIEAASASGAAATFSVSAVDAVDGPVIAACTPASGTIFPLGTTPVNCGAADSSGNAGAAAFTVTVQDTTAPIVHVPPVITAEAQNAAGVSVYFAPATASDAVGVMALSCDHEAGIIYPIGTTVVTCTATDAAGNAGTGGFDIIVQDTTAPVISVPMDINAAATSSSGANVSFMATATDAVGASAVSCVPPSGSLFPLGITPVACAATDAAGNTGSASFNVAVKDSTIDPGITVFTDPDPVSATRDQYAPISLNFSDPDGIGTYLNEIELWYDDYWVTECDNTSLHLATGFTRTASGISWNHSTVTERGATRCRVLDYETRAMTDGPHVIRARVKDNAGISTDYQWTVSVDGNAPTITPPALCGGFTDSETPTITFGYEDYSGIDAASVSMYIDNVWTSATGGASEVVYTPAPLGEGRHDLGLELYDNAGNRASDDCYFFIDHEPPSITPVSPAEGGRSSTAPLIHAAWADYGAGIDQYAAYMELDGADISSEATFDEYGASYQAYGLAPGAHNIEVGVSDKSGKSATRSWNFTASEPVSWYAPWYDSKPANGMNGNWILISNQDATDAAVDIYIGGQKMAPSPPMADASGQHFLVKADDRISPQFTNIASGPVQVISTTGEELLVSQRVIFKDSFNEVMAVRQSDLDSEYRFTWYDSRPANGMSGNWILIGNVDDSSAIVDVYIHDVFKGAYEIAAGGIVTPQFANLMDGPVKVISRGGQKLIVSQRVIFMDAFTEVMGTPVSQLDDQYYFTWYDSRPENGMRGNWLLVSNENASAAAYVYIDIGGERMKDPGNPASNQFKIAAGGMITPQFPGLMDGPVVVTCASCQEYGGKIMASQRVIFRDSFEEVQGTSPAAMGSAAVFPWYDLLSPQMRGDWILAGNNSGTPATLNISIGDAPMMNAATSNYGFSIDGFDNITPSFPTIMDGPVTVSCVDCTGQKLIVSQRVIYLNSFNEVVGRPPRSH